MLLSGLFLYLVLFLSLSKWTWCQWLTRMKEAAQTEKKQTWDFFFFYYRFFYLFTAANQVNYLIFTCIENMLQKSKMNLWFWLLFSLMYLLSFCKVGDGITSVILKKQKLEIDLFIVSFLICLVCWCDSLFLSLWGEKPLLVTSCVLCLHLNADSKLPVSMELMSVVLPSNRCQSPAQTGPCLSCLSSSRSPSSSLMFNSRCVCPYSGKTLVVLSASQCVHRLQDSDRGRIRGSERRRRHETDLNRTSLSGV